MLGMQPVSSAPVSSPVVRQRIITLSDNFNDNTINTALWTQYNSASETGGQLSLSGSLGGQYSGYVTISEWSLVDSEASIELVSAGNQSLVSWEVYVIQVYQSVNSNNGLYWLINQNSVQAYKQVAGTPTTVGASFTYNSSTHKWFKIRVSGSTVFYDYSTDGVSYTNHTSTALPFDVSSMYLEPAAGNYAAEASVPSAILDNLNVTAANTTLTPGVASITLTTFAPTVTVSANTAVTPSTASITLTTFAPTVQIGTVLTPGTASLTLTTFAPSVTVGVRVTPGVASILLTTFAPTVTATDNKTVTPGVASITLTTFAPTVRIGTVLTPGTASIATTLFAPTVTVSDNKLVTPGTAAITLTTFAPTVTVLNNQTVTPGTASITLTTYAPTVLVSLSITPGVASITLTTYAPNVVVGTIRADEITIVSVEDTVTIKSYEDNITIMSVQEDNATIRSVEDSIIIRAVEDVITIRG